MTSAFGPNPFATGMLAALAAQIANKPRSPSEWSQRFSHWAKSESDTEATAIERAERQVRRALDQCAFLADKPWKIIPQGSYRNNTNVRNDSDVDLCVCLTELIYVDGPSGDVPTLEEVGLFPSPIRFLDLKAHVDAALAGALGRTNVTAGEKAIHVNKENDDKISVDVVPAFTYRLYGPREKRGTPTVGIAFDTTPRVGASKRINNFPDQHYQNGAAKNIATARRFKRVVRIIKLLRNHMADNPECLPAMRSCASGTPSFLIESLVYNCPESLFVEDLYAATVYVLQHLANELAAPGGNSLLNLPNRTWWREVNGVKYLFLGTEQPWSEAKALEFVLAAIAYMDI
ncbi:MAG: nucleotidyltransferase [Alphaproteobacteria bacterium]